MEQRFGGFADGLLTREGIVTDDDSRWKLIEALARDLTEAAKKLARNADGDYSRIRDLVRRVVSDPRVQPNHAWRYTFKTYGHEAGLNELTLDAICGHAARTKGEDYTKVTLKKRMEAMVAFPRYRIDGTDR